MLRRFIEARDFYAGLLLIVLGSVSAQQGISYRLGTLTNMGPGFMPAVFGGILVLLGIIVACGAATSPGDDAVLTAQNPTDWMGCLCIIAGPLLFILLVERFGLAPASFACVFVAALGDRSTTWRGAAVLALCVAGFGVLLFNIALKVPLPILQWDTSP